jgi:two-component system, OmpR family, phosphate regulon sensor histidine kinase PhoR
VRNRIFFKLLAAFAVVIAGATITLDISIREVWRHSLLEQIDHDLEQKTAMFANLANAKPSRNVQELTHEVATAAGARATVIDSTGKVLADSEADTSTMENHATRPEFAAALQGRTGRDQRRSRTIGVPLLYVALPIRGGAVRLAYPLADIEASVGRVQGKVFLGSALAMVVALFLAAIAAQSISQRLQRIVLFAERISSGDLTARIAATSHDEIGQVASALDKTARQFEANFEALSTSQRQLETLLNSMQDAVIAIGPDERVQWANQTMDRLLPGRTRIQAPIVETVRDPDFLRTLRTASETLSPSSARATTIVTGRAFEVTAAPMPSGGTVVVLRDLTETERVEKTRRDFIANVSHELRTPLTSIQGYTETLLDAGAGNDHMREFLEIIRKNAFRMSRLTEDLLALARVESGEQRFDIQPVTPEELLREASKSFAAIARAQGVRLEIENTATELVNADTEAIHQVFSNLIENALKYAASTDRIVLGARSSEHGVEFFVRDFGPGIPSEHLARLFERFYRVDKARSRESGGTGLGLAIAKHIVLAHGATIRAESDLNHGSTFLFTLPLASRSEPVAPV